jgi:hypothetical protein
MFSYWMGPMIWIPDKIVWILKASHFNKKNIWNLYFNRWETWWTPGSFEICTFCLVFRSWSEIGLFQHLDCFWSFEIQITLVFNVYFFHRICSREHSTQTFIHPVNGASDSRLLQLGPWACTEEPASQSTVPTPWNPPLQVTLWFCFKMTQLITLNL